MEQYDLLGLLTHALEQMRVRYLVTGSVATVAYGDPRFTNDIDVVIELPADKVDALCATFPAPEYYLSREAVARAVQQRFAFNILHPSSGLKVDVFIAADDDFDRSRLARAVRLPTGPAFEAWFASPEDVILKKLAYYEEGGAEKHIRDIVGVLKLQGNNLDRAYIQQWAARLGLMDTWQQIVSLHEPRSEH